MRRKNHQTQETPKVYLRTEARRQRDALSPQEIEVKSAAITDSILQIIESRRFHTIMLYLDMGSEVRTIPLMHKLLAADRNKKLCVYELNQHIIDNLWLVDSDDVMDGVRQMINAATDLGSVATCLISGAGNRFAGAPWPMYDTDYQPRKIVTALGLPTI